MKPAIQLNIGTPCQENWFAMTAADQGRFCQTCTKQVVDFSTMTDQQILYYLSQASGSICGRLAGHQLQRPLVPAAQQPKTKWWWTLLMPLLMVFDRVSAQTQRVPGEKREIPIVPADKILKVPANVIVSDMIDRMMPCCFCAKGFVITGIVTDKEGTPLEGAVISVKAKEIATTITDSAGHYRLQVNEQEGVVELSAGFVGYETLTKYVVVGRTAPIDFSLSEPVGMFMGEVVVVSHRKKASRIKPSLFTDSLTNGSKITGKQPFTVYPNPVRKGQQFTIMAKETDTYTVQVVNGNGLLLFSQRYTASKGIKQPVNVPADWVGGMYYVHLVSEKDKKQYTEKLLVQ
jgi:hypothetical protein